METSHKISGIQDPSLHFSRHLARSLRSRFADASCTARPKGSAELYSAVSQICNLQAWETLGRWVHLSRAECNSAIRQIENLRYFLTVKAR